MRSWHGHHVQSLLQAKGSISYIESEEFLFSQKSCPSQLTQNKIISNAVEIVMQNLPPVCLIFFLFYSPSWCSYGA